MMRLTFAFVLLWGVFLAGTAAADPATAVITALVNSGVLLSASGVGAALIRIGVGLAFSALSSALAAKAANDGRRGGGVRTETITAGDTTQQSFILGRYMTAGNLAAPEMSHGIDGDSRYLTRVVDLSDIQCTGLESIILDGKPMLLDGAVDPDYGPTTTYGDYALDGGFVFGKFYSGSQTSADAMLLAKYGSLAERPWLSDMIGRGVAYAIMTFKMPSELDLWTGSPDCKFVVNGIRLYDPRKDSTAGGSGAHRYGTQSTHEFSANPVVMIYNILRGIVMLGGNTFGGGYGAADLPYSTWAAAMNACDVTVGSRARYTAGYEVKIGTGDLGGDSPLDVIDELLKACSGQIADVGGTCFIQVGPPALPSYFMTDDDILRTQPQDLDLYPALESTYNGLHATFPSPTRLWQAFEAPPRYDTDAIAAAGGQRLIADLTLPAVTVGGQAQQLMRGWLRDAQRFRRHNVTLPPEGVLLNPLDVVDWTSERNGYSGKDFEIGQVGIDPRTLATTLALREVDPSDYDWVSGDEIAVTAPSVVPVTRAARTVPAFAVAPFTINGTGGTQRAAIKIFWSGPLPGITSIKWQVRLTSTSEVVARGVTSADDGEHIIRAGILPNTAYQVRARLVSRRNTVWTSWTSVTTGAIYIKSRDIEEGSIFPSRWAFGDASNLVPDGEITDEDGWSNASLFVVEDSTNPNSDSDGRLRYIGPVPFTGPATSVRGTKKFRVRPGQVLFCYGQANGNGGTYNVDFTILFQEKNGTNVAFADFGNLTYASPDSALRQVTGSLVVPPLAYKAIYLFRVNSCSADLRLGGPIVYRKKNKNTIEDNGVERVNLKDGSVTDAPQDTALTEVALTTTFATIVEQTIGAAGTQRAFLRASSIQARKVGSGNTEIRLQSRIDEFGSGYGPWVDIGATEVVTDTVFNRYRTEGVVVGPWSARQWRLQARVTSASATTAIRNAYLTFMDITK